MSESKYQIENRSGSEIYEIRIKGHLQERWAELFENMTLTRQEDGTSMIYGHLRDQTALHGVLLKIRNMNLHLISVRKVEQDLNDRDNKPKSERKEK